MADVIPLYPAPMHITFMGLQSSIEKSPASYGPRVVASSSLIYDVGEKGVEDGWEPFFFHVEPAMLEGILETKKSKSTVRVGDGSWASRVFIRHDPNRPGRKGHPRIHIGHRRKAWLSKEQL